MICKVNSFKFTLALLILSIIGLILGDDHGGEKIVLFDPQYRTKEGGNGPWDTCGPMYVDHYLVKHDCEGNTYCRRLGLPPACPLPSRPKPKPAAAKKVLPTESIEV